MNADEQKTLMDLQQAFEMDLCLYQRYLNDRIENEVERMMEACCNPREAELTKLNS
jgi:hypothetical protein